MINVAYSQHELPVNKSAFVVAHFLCFSLFIYTSKMYLEFCFSYIVTWRGELLYHPEFRSLSLINENHFETNASA